MIMDHLIFPGALLHSEDRVMFILLQLVQVHQEDLQHEHHQLRFILDDINLLLVPSFFFFMLLRTAKKTGVSLSGIGRFSRPFLLTVHDSCYEDLIHFRDNKKKQFSSPKITPGKSSGSQ